MDAAGKVYAQNPDPETKLGDLKTMELGKLKIIQNRYKNIVGNRGLLSRLKDRGESARRVLAAVEAELTARGQVDSEPPPLESREAAAEIDRLAQRMAHMEWTTGRRAGERAEPLDSDDDPDPDEMQAGDTKTSPTPGDDASPPGPGPGAVPTGTTRQLLPKSAISQRETRFLTNRPRPDGGAPPTPPAPGPARRTIVAQWADSALAAPDRPDVKTRLLGMDESLQLLTEHSLQTQAERSTRFAPADEDIQMDLDADPDSDMEEAGRQPALGIPDET